MRAPFLARKLHKWIALIVGVQALFWMVSGAYMSTVDIDFIHGDSLVRNTSQPLSGETSALYSITDVVGRFPQATAVDIRSIAGVPYYIVRAAAETVLLDARSGALRSPIERDQAIALANHYYAGAGSVAEALLLVDDGTKPSEIQTRPLPLWQVVFDDGIKTTFYISPSTGELITRRHTFWRLYDFLWMFHIMDYENRADFNNNLLRISGMVGFLMALSGIWLLFHSLKGRRASKTDTSADAPRPGQTYDPVPKTS